MLPQVDTLEYNDKLITEFMKEKQEKLDLKLQEANPENDIYKNFIDNDEFNEMRRVDEISCVLQMFKCKFVKHVICLVLTKFFDFMILATIYYCTAETRYYRDVINYHGLQENYKFFIFVFLALILFQLFSTLLSSYNSVDVSRTSLRMHTAAVSLIYKKIFRINPNMNKLIENETEIINHIQGDANKLQDLPQITIYLIGCVIEVLLGIGVGVYFFSWPFMVFILTTILFGVFASFLYKIYLSNMQDYYDLRENTQSMLRNIVKN